MLIRAANHGCDEMKTMIATKNGDVEMELETSEEGYVIWAEVE